ncbi:hypothetical protein, partial [Salmonella enterica]|uniref:hypothetical protein n=1 Tax=Salmonella enterica TaxID=28901 RepID=UPI003296E9E2
FLLVVTAPLLPFFLLCGSSLRLFRQKYLFKKTRSQFTKLITECLPGDIFRYFFQNFENKKKMNINI